LLEDFLEVMQNRAHKLEKKQTKRNGGRKGTVAPNGYLLSPNTSAYIAKQKAGVCMLLHYGQSFSFDEPTLHETDQRIFWIVPVWFSTADEGRKEKLGELVIDAQTGEVIDGQARCQAMKKAARTLRHPSQILPPLSSS
jgi:hypothetical protein